MPAGGSSAKTVCWQMAEHTMLIAEQLPCARLAILPGGHDVAAVHPDAFNQAVLAFLEETEEESR